MFFSKDVEIFFKFRPDLNGIGIKNSMEIHYVDAGQSDCTLIRLPDNQTIMIDTGVKSEQKTVKKYLDKIFLEKEKTINHLILTHSDSDHTGNAEFVLDNYKVENIYLPDDSIVELLDENKPEDLHYINIINKVNNIHNNNIIVHKNFDDIEIKDTNTGEVYLDWLYPNTEDISNTNDYSPIILVGYKEKYTMLCGDASIDAENVCMMNNQLKPVSVLKFAHHGSGHSTGEAFLKELNPQFAIVSCGKNNIYDFPSEDLLDRVYKFSPNLYNNIFRTDKDGNIIEQITENGELNFYKISNINKFSFTSWSIIGTFAVVILIFSAMNIKNKKRTKVTAV